MTCSIGVSPNKLLSKIGSDFEKPDGLTVIKPDYISEFLSQLDIRNIPGIGKKTESILAESNCKKINDLLNMDVFELNSRFGRKTGTYIYNAARGIDLELVKEKQPSLQYSKITTLKENSKNYEFLSTNLLNFVVWMYFLLHHNMVHNFHELQYHTPCQIHHNPNLNFF